MPKVIPEIVDRLAEESAFLWSLRDAAVSAPNYLLADLVRLDERVEAQLDGLGVMGEPGWVVARQALQAGQAGEVFVAAVLAFQGRDEGKINEVLEAAVAQPGSTRGLSSALGWLPYEQVSHHIKARLAAESPVLRRVGLVAAVLHRRRPGADAFEAAMASSDSRLRSRALRAIGELGLIDLQLAVRGNLRVKDPSSRFWAAWSSALLTGHEDAVAHLQGIAELGGPFAARATPLAARRLAPGEARAWLRRLVKDLRQFRIALIAAGALGDPDAVPFLIDQMKLPAMARVAGEAFSLITGVHVAYDKLERPKPEGFEAGPTEDPEDEDVAMDPDEHLPWPDPALVQKWWAEHQGNFAKGTRYLLGHPISEASLLKALKTGYQRQRSAAALELAILHPGRPLFEVRAPGSRQQRLLA